mgnify:CR=1 FL=1
MKVVQKFRCEVCHTEYAAEKAAETIRATDAHVFAEVFFEVYSERSNLRCPMILRISLMW